MSNKSEDVVRFEQCLQIKDKISERLTSVKSLLSYKKEELDSIKKASAEEFGEDNPEMLADLYTKRVQENVKNTKKFIKELSFLEGKIIFVEKVLNLDSPNPVTNTIFNENDIESSYLKASNLSNTFSQRLARIESAASFAKKQLDEMREYCRERFGEHSSKPLAELYQERVEENNTRLSSYKKELNLFKSKIEKIEKSVNSFKGR